ncbi:hypothetical protein CLOM_g19335 [Closterium sp. NIES-68]|nr:hypothetical protein CLOM_g19335 [Closterium sp. NIES-68]GJP58961.1 hypothetical protein CLOP_g6727 [Closterium sp. NIES-67]
MTASADSAGVGGQLQVSVVQGRHVRQPGEDADSPRGTIVSVQLGGHQIRTKPKAGASPKWLQDFKLPVESTLLFWCQQHESTKQHVTHKEPETGNKKEPETKEQHENKKEPENGKQPVDHDHTGNGPSLLIELLLADEAAPTQSQSAMSASGSASGQCLGRACVPLAGLLGGATVVRWYQVADNEGCLVGEICVVSRFLRPSASGSSCSSGARTPVGSGARTPGGSNLAPPLKEVKYPSTPPAAATAHAAAATTGAAATTAASYVPDAGSDAKKRGEVRVPDSGVGEVRHGRDAAPIDATTGGEATAAGRGGRGGQAVEVRAGGAAAGEAASGGEGRSGEGGGGAAAGEAGGEGYMKGEASHSQRPAPPPSSSAVPASSAARSSVGNTLAAAAKAAGARGISHGRSHQQQQQQQSPHSSRKGGRARRRRAGARGGKGQGGGEGGGVWSAGQVLLGVAGALFGVAVLSMVVRRRQRRLALLHEVQKGETMCSIASRYCVNPDKIIDANVAEGIDDPDVIYPGDVILIPPT